MRPTRQALAGLTTAVMLVPQGMAYALLAGLPPIHALYASTVPLWMYAAVGTSGHIAVGPTALDAILVGSALLSVGASEAELPATAALLALLTGGLLLLAGALRLGRLTALLTPAVLGGFTSAAAFIIGLSQLPLLFGVDVQRTRDQLGNALELARALPDADPLTIGLGFVGISFLLWAKRSAPRVPRFLVVVVGSILLTRMGLDVPVIGSVPSGLPVPELPRADLERAVALLPWAGILALVCSMETLSIGRHFDDGTVRPNRELFGVGLANIASGVFGGFNVAAGFSRSAVHANAGATHRLAGAFTALGVIVVLVGLTGPLAGLPRATLAAIILSSLGSFVKTDQARSYAAVDRPSLLVFLVTFALTLGWGIVPGMLLGIAVQQGVLRLR